MLGHFARECRGPRNQDNRSRNQDNSRRTINVEEIFSKDMLAIDGAGFDWSFIADEKVPSDMALMAFSDSENEVLFCEKIAVLKRDISYKDSEISELKSELEKLKQEKESNQLKIENFDNASKSLDKLIGSQIPDKSREGLGFASYNAIPLPHTGLFAPPTLDLSNSGLEEFQQPEFEGYGPKISKSVSENVSNEVRKSTDAPLVDDLVSDVDKFEKKTGHPQIEDQGYVDSGCSRHMTRYMSYLSDFKEFNGDMLPLGRAKGGRFTGKATQKASLTSNIQHSNSQPLFMLHMDLVFGPTFVSSLMNKKYCLVVTDDYSRFTWVFFLASKDETSNILKSLITQIENLVDKKVKIIRCDNGTEFKNRVMSEFCEKKGIKREFSIAKTPQQNGVAERRNRTLIEAARTMLADSKLPTTFWAKAVNTGCYVPNRVLIFKPHNKTHYELFRGRTPALSFMRPFGCHVTILNTLDHLGKFDGKSDDGFFVGYSLNSKAFRVYNIRIRKVEENSHVRFLEDKPIIAGAGPKWLFDIDVLTESMNYVPVVVGTNSNVSARTKESIGASHSSKETGSFQDCILMPLWKDGSLFDSFSKNASNDEPQPSNDTGKKNDDSEIDNQERPEKSTQDVNTVGPSINIVSTNDNTGSLNINIGIPTVNTIPLEDTHTDFFGDETDVDMSNISTTYPLSSTPNTRIHKDHLLEEPKKLIQALKDPSWIESMQEELLHFKLQQVWTLVDLPYGKRAIRTKWVYKNKKDERGIVISNKARLVAQGYTQEKGINYDEVFARVARIEAIRLFLAYASFKDFVVYQMDVKSAFLYGEIEEEVYVCQPPGFEDPKFPNKVYKVDKALYGLHQAPRTWYETLSTIYWTMDFKEVILIRLCSLKRSKFNGELTLFLGLQVTQKYDGIFISQDKYVEEILKKFGFSTVKTASTLMKTSKPFLKDAKAKDVDLHLYRSMIGSLRYLTASRSDIMFAVCACARFQVTPKGSHLHAVKRIFRYLKGQPKLGLWYPKDSPFDLEAYTDSDYVGASLDRKSTIEGCQFLGSRLISWQCKK
ncbi:putative ribonuclease H-like domain-containing protein [Tanacetum coccineum]